MTGDSGLDLLLFGFIAITLLSFSLTSAHNKKVDRMEEENSVLKNDKQSIRQQESQELTEESFNDLMVLLLEINAITYNQYMEILPKALPYFTKKKK